MVLKTTTDLLKVKSVDWTNISSTVIAHETGNGGDRGETGRCKVHCINGNCVDGRCQCRSGYQGEFCNERKYN